MARQFLHLLGELGHDVEIASTLRAWDAGDEERQEAILDAAIRERERLLIRWQARPPNLWFTYHLYHKAPDYLGPAIADALGIAYVVAEPPISPARANGRWRRPWAHVRAAIERADALLAITSKDERGLLAAGVPRRKIVRLPPFINATDVSTGRKEARLALVRDFGLDSDCIIAVPVAMMRPGDKLESYRVLARTLATLDRDDMQLLVFGDGPSRSEVEHLLAGRAVFAGVLDEESIRRIMAGCDLFIWPAINEAYGMAILLAQACGCPVAAGDAAGVGEIVNHGDTGLLAPAGDAAAPFPVCSTIPFCADSWAMPDDAMSCGITRAMRRAALSPGCWRCGRETCVAETCADNVERGTPDPGAERHPPFEGRQGRGQGMAAA